MALKKSMSDQLHKIVLVTVRSSVVSSQLVTQIFPVLNFKVNKDPLLSESTLEPFSYEENPTGS